MLLKFQTPLYGDGHNNSSTSFLSRLEHFFTKQLPLRVARSRVQSGLSVFGDHEEQKAILKHLDAEIAKTDAMLKDS